MNDDCIFDPVGVPRKDPVVVVPTGNYLVSVEKSMVLERNGGKSLFTVFNVLSPRDHRDKSITHNFTIFNPKSEDNTRIGKQQLANFLDCFDLGGQKLNDVNVLKGKNLKIYVDQSEYQGERRNNVKSFVALSDVDLNILAVEDKGTNVLTEDVPF